MFHEKRIRSVPFLQVSELADVSGLVHAFTFRPTDAACGLDRDPDQATRKAPVLEALGLSEAETTQLHQIHSNRLCRPALPLAERPQGDALVLTEPGVYGIIKTADCLPALAIDPRRRQLAVVHAGWRGTLERILTEALLQLTALGSNPADLIVVLGPCIRSCCYEVGPDFKDRFADRGHDVERLFRGRNLDLVEANRAESKALEVGQIVDSGMCTCCSPDLFYSHRRDQDPRRMWALAGFSA